MIVIGRLHTGPILPEWLTGWEELRKPITPDGRPDWATYSAVRQVVHHARNDIAAVALAQHTDATHLFFLDDDIVLPPDGLMRLLQDSAEHDLPLVTGLYLQRGEPHLPVVYRQRLDDYHHVQITRFAPGLQEVDACGAGCLLIRMDVLRAIAATGEKPFDYRLDMSEDIAFCVRARHLGFRIALDFDVSCQHLTTIAVTYETHADRLARGLVAYASEELAQLSQEIRPITGAVAPDDATPDAGSGASVPEMAGAATEP